MCNLTAFIVVVPVEKDTSTTLVTTFMQYVLLKFGIHRILVIDNGNPFKTAFTAIFNSFNNIYEIIRYFVENISFSKYNCHHCSG